MEKLHISMLPRGRDLLSASVFLWQIFTLSSLLFTGLGVILLALHVQMVTAVLIAILPTLTFIILAYRRSFPLKFPQVFGINGSLAMEVRNSNQELRLNVHSQIVLVKSHSGYVIHIIRRTSDTESKL